MQRCTKPGRIAAWLCGFVFCCVGATGGGASPPIPVSHYERPTAKSGPFKDRVIVFVHGIFGDAHGTWTSTGGAYWPKLLLSDRAFDESDIYVANYRSPVLGNTMTVDEIVANLNSRFTADGVFEKHREVVFVCHSLGGIVVQQLLLTFRDEARKVPLIYFFAVPEEGSQVAKFGSLLSSDPLLQVLLHGDENGYMLTLENQWKAAHFGIHRYCAYEKKPLKGTALIVDRLSGSRNCDDPAIPIDEDHFGIVKPNGVEHDSYIALRNAILANPISPTPNAKFGKRKALVGSASIKYVQINTTRLVEGDPLRITVHAQIAGQVHDFLLSPNLAIIQFNQMPITEKEDIEADAAARRQQANMKNALPSLSQRPPDILTSSVEPFQTAVYSNVAKREVDGFITGQTRIYLMTFIAWKDGNNTAGSYDSCVWLQSMPSPEIGLQHAVWHECR